MKKRSKAIQIQRPEPGIKFFWRRGAPRSRCVHPAGNGIVVQARYFEIIAAPVSGISADKRMDEIADNYWSSTTNANNTNNAWNVNFNNGNVNNNNKTNTNYVRCVSTGA